MFSYFEKYVHILKFYLKIQFYKRTTLVAFANSIYKFKFTDFNSNIHLFIYKKSIHLFNISHVYPIFILFYCLNHHNIFFTRSLLIIIIIFFIYLKVYDLYNKYNYSLVLNQICPKHYIHKYMHYLNLSFQMTHVTQTLKVTIDSTYVLQSFEWIHEFIIIDYTNLNL